MFKSFPVLRSGISASLQFVCGTRPRVGTDACFVFVFCKRRTNFFGLALSARRGIKQRENKIHRLSISVACARQGC